MVEVNKWGWAYVYVSSCRELNCIDQYTQMIYTAYYWNLPFYSFIVQHCHCHCAISPMCVPSKFEAFSFWSGNSRKHPSWLSKASVSRVSWWFRLDNKKMKYMKLILNRWEWYSEVNWSGCAHFGTAGCIGTCLKWLTLFFHGPQCGLRINGNCPSKPIKQLNSVD